MGKKNKVILPPNLPPEVADDEIEVSDEDLEFVGRNREYVGFLTKLDTKSIDRLGISWLFNPIFFSFVVCHLLMQV